MEIRILFIWNRSSNIYCIDWLNHIFILPLHLFISCEILLLDFFLQYYQQINFTDKKHWYVGKIAFLTPSRHRTVLYLLLSWFVAIGLEQALSNSTPGYNAYQISCTSHISLLYINKYEPVNPLPHNNMVACHWCREINCPHLG